jgi:transcriptional regulator with XRE-family HTH domain
MGFGQTLQKLRLEAGLSQSGLATKAGIPVKTIQNWEISRRTPRWIVLLVKLAQGLNVPMEKLVADVIDVRESDETVASKKSHNRARKGK